MEQILFPVHWEISAWFSLRHQGENWRRDRSGVKHGGARLPPKCCMRMWGFWLIFYNFVTFHHFFTKLGNLIWDFVPNNLT